jgi:hypothetical protein
MISKENTSKEPKSNRLKPSRIKHQEADPDTKHNNNNNNKEKDQKKEKKEKERIG